MKFDPKTHQMVSIKMPRNLYPNVKALAALEKKTISGFIVAALVRAVKTIKGKGLR